LVSRGLQAVPEGHGVQCVVCGATADAAAEIAHIDACRSASSSSTKMRLANLEEWASGSVSMRQEQVALATATCAVPCPPTLLKVAKDALATVQTVPQLPDDVTREVNKLTTSAVLGSSLFVPTNAASDTTNATSDALPHAATDYLELRAQILSYNADDAAAGFNQLEASLDTKFTTLIQQQAAKQSAVNPPGTSWETTLNLLEAASGHLDLYNLADGQHSSSLFTDAVTGPKWNTTNGPWIKWLMDVRTATKPVATLPVPAPAAPTFGKKQAVAPVGTAPGKTAPATTPPAYKGPVPLAVASQPPFNGAKHPGPGKQPFVPSDVSPQQGKRPQPRPANVPVLAVPAAAISLCVQPERRSVHARKRSPANAGRRDDAIRRCWWRRSPSVRRFAAEGAAQSSSEYWGVAAATPRAAAERR
jgi:hypothetical protein